MKLYRYLLALVVLVSCGTSDHTSTVGGTVAGLSGTVVLQNNAIDNLTLTANGVFTFSTPLINGSAYSVTVLTNPAGQTCVVSNGSGTIDESNIINVAVTCSLQVFSTSATTGNLSGRSGADASCSAAQGSLSCSTVHALISIEANDAISDMPTNYAVPTSVAVVSATNIQIAANWAALLNTSSTNLNATLAAAGITSSDWWSGSLPNGNLESTIPCGFWTSTAGTGSSGVSNATNSTWINAGLSACNLSKVLLCLCY